MAAAGQRVDYKVGTMIEVPRGALRAGDLAKTAEFFSFGTNDLTQVCVRVCIWLRVCLCVHVYVCACTLVSRRCSFCVCTATLCTQTYTTPCDLCDPL